MANKDLKSWTGNSVSYLNSKKSSNFGSVLEDNFEIPTLIELLGNFKQEKIIEFGCGDGELVNFLDTRGAKVVGVDGSSSQIEIARSKYSKLEFVEADLTKKFPFKNSSFEKAISRFLLMLIPNTYRFAKETARILKPGGKFIFTITHPFYPYVQELTKTPNRYTGMEIYGEIRKGKISFGESKYSFYFKPIEEFMKPFLKTGFVLNDFKEIVPPDKLIDNNSSLERMRKKPVFLMLGFHLNK